VTPSKYEIEIPDPNDPVVIANRKALADWDRAQDRLRASGETGMTPGSVDEDADARPTGSEPTDQMDESVDNVPTEKTSSRPALNPFMAMIRARMKLGEGQEALDVPEGADGEPQEWKKWTALEVLRARSEAYFNELDSLVQDRTPKLTKLLQDLKIHTYILGTELDDDRCGAHFHIYFKSRMTVDAVRQAFDAYSREFEELTEGETDPTTGELYQYKSVNSVQRISKSNFKFQAGYAAKEHRKPWKTHLNGTMNETGTLLDLPEGYRTDYYGGTDPHVLPHKEIREEDTVLRWREGYLRWVNANNQRKKQRNAKAKYQHEAGLDPSNTEAKKGHNYECDLMADIKYLQMEGYLTLKCQKNSYTFDCTHMQILILLKQQKRPCGQMKWKQFKDAIKDAEADAIAGLLPSPKAAEKEAPRPVEKMRPWNGEFDDTKQEYLRQFLDPTLFRYKFLVIVGESRTGKSLYAQYNLGFKNPYVQNSGWDWSNYDPEKHDAIILNDVHDIATRVREYRTLFQSGEHDTTVGDSRTNCYSQRVSTNRKPIVVTMNRDGEAFTNLARASWVQANAIVLDCGDTKMFEEDPDITEEELARQATHKRQMDEWENAATGRPRGWVKPPNPWDDDYEEPPAKKQKTGDPCETATTDAPSGEE
jgi:hypothetical protein